MKKIRDRFVLGVIAGIGGNIAKRSIERYLNQTGYTKRNAYDTAAGIFLKKSDIFTPQGRFVGIVADNVIAAALGVLCIYWFTLMGKDHFLIKGAGLGALEWGSLYGVLSRLGATEIYPVKPRDSISNFLSHLVFGAVKAAIAVNLGDNRLFSPEKMKEKIYDPQVLCADNPQYLPPQNHAGRYYPRNLR